MSQLPRFRSYGNYSSDNYGAHCLQFSIGSLTIYFSYQTPIAFSSPFSGMVVQKNYWGPTTGKHLNWIDGRNTSGRVNEEIFNQKFQETLAHYGLSE